MAYFEQYIYIKKIIDEGSITKAAEKLYVSQPYLSKYIKNIEEELGIKILERLHRSVRLTYAGERYLNFLERVSQVEDQMKKELELIADHKQGQISIGINPALGTSVLPVLLSEFNKHYPLIDIDLHEADAATIEKRVEDYIVDIGIGMTPIMNEKVTYELIYSDYMFLLVSKNSKLYNPENTGVVRFPYGVSVLNDEPLIKLKEQYGMGRVVNDFFERYDLTQNIILRTETIYTAIELVKKGMGSTFIPSTGMAPDQLKDFNIFQLNSDILKSGMAIFYNKNNSFTPPVKKFIQLAKNLLKEKYAESNFYLENEEKSNDLK